LLRRFHYYLSLLRAQQGKARVEVHPSCEESAHPFLELMLRDPHERAGLTSYRLPVHHPRAEVEEAEVEAEALRPEVEVEGAEVGAEVLHHPEVAGVVEAVEAVGVQGQDRSLREEEAVVLREALFFLAEVQVAQVLLDGQRGAMAAVAAVAAQVVRLR
jgi:hypothetical protein